MLLETPFDCTQMKTLITSLILDIVRTLLQIVRKTQAMTLRRRTSAPQAEQLVGNSHELSRHLFAFSFALSFAGSVMETLVNCRFLEFWAFERRFINV